jgi:HAE1 family hydrophobic/amphiphilic exporter-1
MMTTMAAICASLPLALGTGTGSEIRQPLGIAVVGGLVFSQLLTLYVTPTFFVSMERLVGLFRGGERPAVEALGR